MTDDEFISIVVPIAIIVLYLGYVVNKWKIQDLEDRVERLERSKEDS